MHDLIDRNTKWITLPMMAVLSAAILFHQNELVIFDEVINVSNVETFSHEVLSGFMIFTYLCLLFATFVKKRDQRSVFLILGAISGLYGGFPWTSGIFGVSGQFYKYTDTKYWHILTLTLLTLIVSVILIVLTWSKFEFASRSIKNLVKSTYSGTAKVLSTVMVLPLVILFAGQIYEIWPTLLESYRTTGNYFYGEVLLIVQNIAFFFVALCGFAFLQPVVVKWISVAKEWNEALSDFSLKTYLTRKISSALYSLSYVLVTGVIGIGIPVYAYESLNLSDYFYEGIGFLGPIVFFPVGVLIAIVAWFLFVLSIRLIYEFANAIIHIAENTTK